MNAKKDDSSIGDFFAFPKARISSVSLKLRSQRVKLLSRFAVSFRDLVRKIE